jgi:hypothetical protein
MYGEIPELFKNVKYFLNILRPHLLNMYVFS